MVAPPKPERRPQPRLHHGDVFDDPYEWLRDIGNPEVVAHLEAENAFTASITEPWQHLRQELFDDIAARTQQTDLSVPSFHTHSDGTSWWYYARTVTDLDYPIYCRAPASTRDHPPTLDTEAGGALLPGEHVLLDGNREAEGHPFFSLGAMSVSPNGSMVAFSVDLAGDERYDAYVRVIGGDTTAAMTQIGPGLAWAGDDHLIYVRVDEAWRPHEVWCHPLAEPTSDQLVFDEPDERFWVDASESRDRRWVVVHSGAKLTTSAWLIDSTDPTAVPRPVFERREGLDAAVEICGDEVFVVHNAASPDFQVSRATLGPGAEAAPIDTWTDFAGPTPGVRYTGVDAYDSHVVVARRHDGLAGLEVRSRADAAVSPPITFDESVYEASPMGEEDRDTDRIRISYQSLVTPPSVVEYQFATGEVRTLKTMPVLPHPVHGPYQRDDYVTERAWVPAEDGAMIPLSIVRPVEVPLDGSAPCLLYGYGSYEISIPPAFSISRLSLLDRGFIFVIAHVRGGGEMGRAWYEQGRLFDKENTFTDFVAAGRWLIEQRYTSPDRLVAEGRSAGGLLMGAITNLAPELFRGVHAGVAFVDALTTILDPSLPLTVTEWEEWGDPLHDPAVYRYMKGYTPYENIAPVAYPAILATTSLNDTRVSYVEPTKWVAELRHTTTGPAPILLRIEMDAGHGGVSGRYQQWHERAFELAWIIEVATSAPRDSPAL